MRKTLLFMLITVILGFACTKKQVPEETTVKPSTVPLRSEVSIETLSTENLETIMFAHYINVGQGNATLLEFPCGAVLIDAGSQNENYSDLLVEYLNEFFNQRTDLNRTLDLIIITHNHVDHTRALDNVVNNFTVLSFIENGQRGKSNRDPGDKTITWLYQQVNNGRFNIDLIDIDQSQIEGNNGLTNDQVDPIQCTEIDPLITILSADKEMNPGWSEDDFDNKNNHSIVTRVDFGEVSFLFPGDLEEPAIEDLVFNYSGTDLLDVDIFEVSHHGSYNGTTPSLVNTVTPDIAVISMGSWDDQVQWSAWQYGHPRQDAVILLEDGIDNTREPKIVHIASGVRYFHEEEMSDAIYATGWDGNIVIGATASGNIEVTIDN